MCGMSGTNPTPQMSNPPKSRDSHLAVVSQSPSSPTPDPTPAAPNLADLVRMDIKDVRGVVKMSETAIREKVRAGTFPAPDYRDGPRCVRWNAGTVRRWLENTTGRV